MEKEFIPYEQSLALKELGFNEPCLGCYLYDVEKLKWVVKISINDNRYLHIVSAPLYQQSFKFFRGECKLEASIQRMPPEVYGKGKGDIKNYLVYIWAENLNPRGQFTLHFDTYEEAELECLKKLIEIAQKEIKNVN